MKTAFQVSWPCGYRLYVRRCQWRQAPNREPPSACPLHGRYCPVPLEQPLRQALKALRSEMYELDTGDLYDRLEDIIDEALGPWKLPETDDAPMPGDAS